MKYGIYTPYRTHEWTSDYEYYIPKVKALEFDIMEISYAATVQKHMADEQLLELKKTAENNGIILTAGYIQSKINFILQFKNIRTDFRVNKLNFRDIFKSN